jgi:hypothetical protein
MEEKPRDAERRDSVRIKGVYPAVYTRFDEQGRPFEQKPSRSMDVSEKGLRLQSSFPVHPRELLDIAVALRDRVVSFRASFRWDTSSALIAKERSRVLTESED